VVELAYLTRGQRLGLEGRLDLLFPAIGIAARQLHVAVSLADRVELMAIEGDLVHASGGGWPPVEGFEKAVHHFVHPFYRGDAVHAAVYYQEPMGDTGSQTP
jgi:hypothetical protein